MNINFIASILLISFGYLAIGQNKNYIDQPYIETTAKVDTLVTPNKISMAIIVSESDTKGKISVESLEKKMMQRLETIGINLKKQLFVNDFFSDFKKHFIKKTNILKTKSYQLIVYDATTVSRILYEMQTIGISNLDIKNVEYTQMEQLKIILRAKAIQKAQKQSMTMVKPLNQTIGKAIYISDNNTHTYSRNKMLRVGYASEMSVKSEKIAIELQKIKVDAQVSVKFVLK